MAKTLKEMREGKKAAREAYEKLCGDFARLICARGGEGGIRKALRDIRGDDGNKQGDGRDGQGV